jgi:hypothetical protein
MTFDPARRAKTKFSPVQIVVLEVHGARDHKKGVTPACLLQDAYRRSLCLKKDCNLIQKWDHGDYEIVFPPPKGQLPDELIQNTIKSTHPYGDKCLDFESFGHPLPKLKPHEQRKVIVLNQDIQRLYGYMITESLVDFYLSWRHRMMKVGHKKVHVVPCGPHLR